MKRARWLHVTFLILFLMLGSMQCSGPRSQVAGKTANLDSPKAALKEIVELAKAVPENSPSSPKIGPEEPSKALQVILPDETLEQKVEKRGEFLQAVQPPSGPSGISSRTTSLVAPPPGGADPPGNTSKLVLNFDNADIYEVIRVMAAIMNINYIIDPRIKGVVNIHTTGQISAQNIFPIFQAILNTNGATAVKRGIIYEIIPFGEAKKVSPPLLVGQERGKSYPNEQYNVQIIGLKYIPSGEASKMLKHFLTDGADIIEFPPQNILIVCDLASNIQKAINILDLLDVDIFADMRVRIYPLLNSFSEDVAKEMERIFSSFEVSVKSGRGVGITFTPISRINSLLVVSSIPGIFDKVEKWLKELDRTPREGTKLSVFVYYAQNGKAKDMAEVLRQVYIPSKTAAKAGEKTSISTSTSASSSRGAKTSPSPTTPVGPASSTLSPEAQGGGEGEINIVVDEVTNSLIIRAYQRDYWTVMETIKKLDIYPKQVLIEVLIGEVTLNDATKLGLEFSTFSDSFVKGGRTYSYSAGMGGIAQATDFSSGLRYAVTSVDRLTAAIQASASEDRLKVVSSPHILASNNKEAKIQVGSSQPILTNTYTTTASGTTTSTVEGTIEYKDIGIILTVTPRINDGKLVTLDLSVESSTVGQTTLGSLSNVPYFGKKTAKTTLSIMEGQTVVIGGLIEDTKNTTSAGVPFLSKIPILGSLFGYQSDTVGKTETVMFLTPHVISQLEDSNRITQEFRDRLWGIQKELEFHRKEREKGKKGGS